MYDRFKYQDELWVLLLSSVFIIAIFRSLPTVVTPIVRSTLPAPTSIIAHPVTSTGCGQKSTVPPGDSETQTISSDNLSRSYLLHIPTSYKDTVQQPLVLNFHGHGDNSLRQALYSNFSPLADHDDFVVAYPQGVIGPDHHTGWSTGPARDPHVNDVLFVSDLLNKLQATLCIDPTRIYATGFSNGGGMTYVLACKMADRFAAFAPVSGSYPSVPGGCAPARPVPILEFHGTGDSVVPYDGSRAKMYPPVQQWLQGWVALDDCSALPHVTHPAARVTEEQWVDCKGDVTIIHYRLSGWPHAWPQVINLRQNLTRPAPDAVSLNATSIIWTFFTQHPLPTNADTPRPSTPG